MTDDTTTIEITEDQRDQLKQLKQHDREGYKDVIARLLGGDQTTGRDGYSKLQEQLDRIESAATTAEDRTGNIQRTLEGLQR